MSDHQAEYIGTELHYDAKGKRITRRREVHSVTVLTPAGFVTTTAVVDNGNTVATAGGDTHE